MDYRSSFAVDKDNVDQPVSGIEPALITAERALWDLNGDFWFADSKFVAPTDGLWNSNGTIGIRDLSGCSSVSLEIWRNDGKWFVVAEKEVNAEGSITLPFSCDMDCYYSSDHYFDLRIRMAGPDPACTISGSDEDTAWGMTYMCSLSGPSPT